MNRGFKAPGKITSFILTLVTLGMAYLLFPVGFDSLSLARQYDRLPYTSLNALTNGQYLIKAIVKADQATLSTPYSGSQAVYFFSLMEQQTTDSEGNTKWETIESNQKVTNFKLIDSRYLIRSVST